MADDEVGILQETLSAHRAMLLGALNSNKDLDIDRAFQVHAGISRILSNWDDYTAPEQRRIVATIQYLIDTDDQVSDLRSPQGFTDDLAQLQQLQLSLGYR